ncbi:PREDICTED: uncharacterized protein LOC106749311 [Dinoponera quadriceps]|uniref:Uncharacterized protein LOC106749311 n=1 Tax=Dinoponera quadriceps TaxID=609295 RepID=A0A6P3Y012_DINQU|nr:PREDICTED: uncharacterized protein LOC106749311 [Dinoponera quadriceps]
MILLEKKSAACVDVHRSARVHRDASQNAPSPTWVESSVSVNFVNSTIQKTPANIPQRLKDLIASYEENVAKLVKHARGMCKNKNDNHREINFQTQLGSLVERVVKDQSKVRNAYAKLGNVTDSTLQVSTKKLTMENLNNLRNLFDTMRELDIIYQDGEITDEHIRIKRTNERGYKGPASDREERIIHTLFNIQRQLTQIRKYLDKLCKKHHATWTTTTEVVNNVSSVDQQNKIPIIQN